MISKLFKSKKTYIFLFILILLIVISIIVSRKNNVTSEEVLKTIEVPDKEQLNNDLKDQLNVLVDDALNSQSISDTEDKVSKMDATINEIIDNMTLEQKIGQMFIVAPETFSSYGTVTVENQLDAEKIKKYNIGGFVLFSKNILNPNQLISLTSYINDINEEIKPFISIDEEGGQVARISNNPNFPDKKIEDMSDIGKNKDYSRAYEVGDTIGKYLNEYGFNMDFAPVCDVYLNNNNSVVNKRSFGNDSELVSKMSLNVMLGLRDNNIISSAKHFPGHGNTSLDTHNGFATNNATLEEMTNTELIPFKNMIDNNIDTIMVSHVIYPSLSEEKTPATLNYDIVTNLLKNEMNYTGVVITDAMNMGAIVNNYNVKESTLKAVNAGIDIILMPADFYEAYDSLLVAVKNGEISEERIDESLYKILKLKLSAGI